MSAVLPDTTDPSAVEEAARALPSAAERLAASRERMRTWMLDADGRHGGRRRALAAAEGGEAEPGLLERLRQAPGVGVVIDAIASWWESHPLRPAASLAGGMVSDRVAPVVRRHPMAVLLGAFLVGVVLVRLRPWRLLARPALVAGLGSQVVARVLAALPLERLFEMFGHAGTGTGEPPPGEPAAGTDETPPAAMAEPLDDAPRTRATAPPVPQATVQAETVTP